MRFADQEVVRSLVPGMSDLAGIGDDIFSKSQIKQPQYDETLRLTPQEMMRREMEENMRRYLQESQRGVKGV